MNVLFLLPGNFIGGGVIVILEHAKRLASAGHKVTVAFADPTSPLSIEYYAQTSAVRTVLLKSVQRVEFFDVALATAWETAFLVHRVRARGYAYFVQDDERRFYDKGANRVARFLVALTYGAPFHFLVTTPWLAEMLRAEFRKKTHLVPIGIDASMFQGKRASRPIGRPLRVLIEGRGGEPRKRVDLAFSAAADVEGIELYYLTADGVHRPQWKFSKMFTKVPHSQTGSIYAECDVLLKLSSQESFALPVIEMFASGGTAIVSAFTGHEQYIADRHNALVVPIDDKEAAVAALKALRDDSELLACLQANASTVAAAYSWDRSHAAMDEALTRIARDGSRRHFWVLRIGAVLFRLRNVYGRLRTRAPLPCAVPTSVPQRPRIADADVPRNVR